jgi:hemerythrin-like domain-containing protein
MNPFDALRAEHQLVRRALVGLMALVERAVQGQDVVRRDLREFVVFFHDYVDLGHQDKEETILLPLLVEHGFDWNDGPIRAVVGQHQHERYLVRVLSDAASQSSEWDAEDLRHFVSIARELDVFLTAHMELEDHAVLAPAERSLPGPAMSRLEQAFDGFEAARGSLEDRARFISRVEHLVSRYVA